MRLALIFIFLILITPTSCMAKSGQAHVFDMLSIVFENANIRSPQVRAYLHEFTKTIDNFEVVKALPLGPDGHRLYGHWGFSDAIPFNREPLKGMLEKIAASEGKEAAHAAKEKIIRAWRNDVANMEKLAARMLGVEGRVAKGFAGLLYDIHLLGDYSGVKLGALQDAWALKNDLLKNINRVFGNNSVAAKEIARGLSAAYKSGGTPAQKSAKMLEYLTGSKEFKSYFQALLQKERFVSTLLKFPVKVDLKGVKTLDDLKKLVKSHVKSDIRLAPALIQEGRLLVALKGGAGAGLLLFAVDSVHPTWQFIKGNMLKPEYEENIKQAAINGTAVGGMSAVMVMLGANPAGIVLVGIATGTYIAVDKLQQIYKEKRDSKYLSKDDLLIFGIKKDSILDINIDKGIPLNVENWYK